MFLYLMTQDETTGYDTYDSVVVCAESEDAARRFNPGLFREWSDEKVGWVTVLGRLCVDDSWVNNISLITVTLLGKAEPNIPIGVVLASYHAGFLVKFVGA